MQTENRINDLIIKDVSEWLSHECWSDGEIIMEIKDSWGLDTALATDLFAKGKACYHEQKEIGDLI